MEKRATTLGLFFALVFVLAITQLVGFVSHDLTLGGFAPSALLMALLWWSWTEYTWDGKQMVYQHRELPGIEVGRQLTLDEVLAE